MNSYAVETEATTEEVVADSFDVDTEGVVFYDGDGECSAFFATGYIQSVVVKSRTTTTLGGTDFGTVRINEKCACCAGDTPFIRGGRV